MSIVRSLIHGQRKNKPGRPHRIHRAKKSRHPWEGKGAPNHGHYKFLRQRQIEKIRLADLETPDDE
ncbi:MAG: hypothetical protein ACREO5_01680 [Candidatus Binatia bacterium]